MAVPSTGVSGAGFGLPSPTWMITLGAGIRLLCVSTSLLGASAIVGACARNSEPTIRSCDLVAASYAQDIGGYFELAADQLSILRQALSKMNPIEPALVHNRKGGVFSIDCADGETMEVVVLWTGTARYYLTQDYKWSCPELDALAESLRAQREESLRLQRRLRRTE